MIQNCGYKGDLTILKKQYKFLQVQVFIHMYTHVKKGCSHNSKIFFGPNAPQFAVLGTPYGFSVGHRYILNPSIF